MIQINNLEDIRCGVGEDEFVIHPSTPISIYILNPYKFIGEDEMALIQCACGCGTWIEDKDSRGRNRRFVNGHYINLLKGEAHPFFGKKHTKDTKRKISEATKGKPKHRVKKSRPLPEKTKRKISDARRGQRLSEETKRKIRESNKGKHTGKNNPNYGKHLSEETREKIRLKLAGRAKTDEWKRKRRGYHHTEETREKIGESKKGEKNPNWKGGISFEPYCPKFNGALKDKVRDKFGHRCFLCNKTEEENGRKLDCHHIDGDKQQGCNSQWFLVPLCRSCHARIHNDSSYAELVAEKMQNGGYLE